MQTVRVARGLGLTCVTLLALAGFLGIVLVLKLAEGLFVTLDIGRHVLRECWRPDARL